MLWKSTRLTTVPVGVFGVRRRRDSGAVSPGETCNEVVCDTHKDEMTLGSLSDG